MELQRNPTQYMVWHELIHYIQYCRILAPAYRNLPRPMGHEEFVCDYFRFGKPWNMLNSREQQDAYDYIIDRGGDALRYLWLLRGLIP
jgi:hypothetical protein